MVVINRPSEFVGKAGTELFVSPVAVVGKHIVFHLVTGTLGREHVRRKVMNRVHQTYNRDRDIDAVVVEMRLHRMKPVDEYFITGEVLTEVIFRISVAKIWAMRQAVHVLFSKGLQRYNKKSRYARKFAEFSVER